MNNHPFLDPSFEVRWSRLNPDHVEADIGQALEDARSRIDAVASQDLANLTFESTFLALENATEGLHVAWSKVGHLDAVCNSPELREAYNAMLPRVSEFNARIPLNAELWNVLKAFGESPAADTLNPVRKRLVTETMADFREHGADLPPEKKQRLEEIVKELAQTTQKYSENVLDATNAYELVIDDESKLEGLPALAREQARLDARDKDLGADEDPKWRFTLHAPSLLPVMRYLDDESIRNQLWNAFSEVGRNEPYDNRGLIWRILELREEKARLLGKDHFADLVLERRMAKNGATAIGFVEDLHDRILEIFNRENSELEAFKAEKTGQPTGPLEPWETLYWSEKLRRERYDFDEEALRPYFPIDQVIDGMFAICERIFGIRIKEQESVFHDAPSTDSNSAHEVWHPEVKYYEIHDGSGDMLGAFYADWHPRESKRSGAWMDHFITGRSDHSGPRERHLGQICGNLTPSIEGKPALLTHDEVLTIFHEFGHLLHHLLGDVEVKSLNGVNVAWDFVELPSQILENWCWERESLNLFARHHETDAPIPDDLFEKMIRARNFQSARATMRQLSFGKMDLQLHIHFPDFRKEDYEKELKKILKSYEPPLKTPQPTIICRFGHLFSDAIGYAAGYYSYKWAEVLDADAFTRFKKEGIMNAQVGREFRDKVLSRGNSDEPGKLFRDFMGRDPELDALLERSGLA